MTDSPFFLAGVDRSGIGLLGEVLERHPRLAVSRRTNFWSFYYRRYGDLSQTGNLERCVDAMLQYRRIRDLGVDRDKLLEQMRHGEPSYGRLLNGLEEQHLHRLGKSRWGDKSLGAEGHATAIFREFPGALIVHMIRDPRDRYASQASHRRPARGMVGSGTALWLWSTRLAEHNQARFGERYLVVRYEDLVSGPEATARIVTGFLGEDFDLDMLSLPSGALHTTSVGRFRHELDRREVAFVEFVARAPMRRMGYLPEIDGLLPAERLRFTLVDLPVNLARLAGWSVGRAVRGLIAPSPSERRLVDV